MHILPTLEIHLYLSLLDEKPIAASLLQWEIICATTQDIEHVVKKSKKWWQI